MVRERHLRQSANISNASVRRHHLPDVPKTAHSQTRPRQTRTENKIGTYSVPCKAARDCDRPWYSHEILGSATAQTALSIGIASKSPAIFRRPNAPIGPFACSFDGDPNCRVFRKIGLPGTTHALVMHESKNLWRGSDLSPKRFDVFRLPVGCGRNQNQAADCTKNEFTDFSDEEARMSKITVPWRELEAELQVCLEALGSLQFGTVNKKARRKADRDVARNYTLVGANTQIEELEFWRQEMLNMGATLSRIIKARRPEPGLLMLWGQFQYACGMVNSVPYTWKDDPAKSRAGLAGGKAVSKVAKRVWVARELEVLMQHGRLRYAAERELAIKISAAIKADKIPAGLSKDWLLDLLDSPKLLKNAYTAKRLPMKTIQALQKMESEYPML